MLDTLQSTHPRSRQGINWSEVWQAYRVFMPKPAQGILHILAAAESSRWQKCVLRRLRRQAAPILDWEVKIDLDKLSELPPDTLGGAYARHMIGQGFTADAFIDRELNVLPFTHRLAISHDVQHIITGFDSSPIGEFGLSAFMLVQHGDMLNVFVLSWVPWFMLGNILSIPKVVATVYRGFLMGWQSRPLVAYPFEVNWDKSILEVRQGLRIRHE